MKNEKMKIVEKEQSVAGMSFEQEAEIAKQIYEGGYHLDPEGEITISTKLYQGLVNAADELLKRESKYTFFEMPVIEDGQYKGKTQTAQGYMKTEIGKAVEDVLKVANKVMFTLYSEGKLIPRE